MRRKLFSDIPRRKLFSEEEEVRTLVCSDCGYQIETEAATTHQACPKCGGTRFNVLSHVFSPAVSPEKVPVEKNYSKRSIFESEEEFQKRFSDTSNEFELKLKRFSGKILSDSEVQRNFGMTSEDLVEKGFADTCEEGIRISDTAFLQSRLFSKLIVSVTKVLDLDPEVTMMGRPKEEIINDLENRGGLCPKGIILIKKAHGILGPGSCCSDDDSERWAHDSGILGDLKLEFGGMSKDSDDFRHTIDKRYPDAPENIIEILKSHGIIKPVGGRIEILK